MEPNDLPEPGPERSPRRSALRVWLLGVGILFLLRLLGHFLPLAGETGWLWITRVGEAWLVAGLVVFVWRDLPFREIVNTVKWRSAALALLVMLIFAGQYIETGGSYPFVDWDMYTARAPEVAFGRVEATLPDGTRKTLSLTGDARISREPRAISGRLLDLAEKARAGDEQAAALLEASLRSLVVLGTDPHPTSVSVLRCTVTEPTLEDPATCQEVVRVRTGDPS